jgi:subtilisin family serine protease
LKKRKHLILAVALILVIIVSGSCKKQKAETNQTEDEICPVTSATIASDNNVYIFILKQDGSSRRSASTAARFTKNILGKYSIAESNLINQFHGANDGAFVKLSRQEFEVLQKDAAIELIEPDRVIQLSTCFEVAEPRTIRWNVKRVGFGDGRGKTVWIIDTGVDTDNPDLLVDMARSRSFISNTTSFEDDNGHGTHVAGIIGANNNSIGVMGVAANANIVALKVLDNTGAGNLSAIIRALSYIGSNSKAGDVVNMSLGLDTVSNILDWEIVALANRGILFSVAAGNDAKPSVKASLARVNHQNVFTVSAIDSLDRWAAFSNYGNDVIDFAAPGVRIHSTYLQGRYAYASGTSMAAPHIAGLLLLNGRNIKSSGFARNDPDGMPDPIASKQ